jgi:two-component system OmpR family sensor kinase
MITSLIFSIIVYSKMSRLAYEFIDADLKTVSSVIARLYANALNQSSELNLDRDFPEVGRYLARLYNQNNTLLYENNLAANVDPTEFKIAKHAYTAEITATQGLARFDYDSDGTVTVRSRTTPMVVNGANFNLLVARPIDKRDKKTYQLERTLFFGFLTAGLSIIVFGYLISGFILKPIGAINKIISSVDGEALYKRIPLRKSHDELNVLSESINGMLERLEVSHNRQRQFVDDAAHELKTPISLLSLSLEKLIQNPDLNASLRGNVVQLSDGLMRIKRLSKSLVDLATLETIDRVNTSCFCLIKLTQSILKEFSEAFIIKKIVVSVEGPQEGFIDADKRKMEHLLRNVIDNAYKFNCKENGLIRITFLDGGEHIDITISNTGPGISAEDLPHVFERFYRADKSRSQVTSGIGLGLALVKRIVEMHGGSLEIKSQIGDWTMLTIHLPKHYCAPRESIHSFDTNA